MTNKEIIEMLLAQKSQIDGRIARIMARDQIDPYAELKQAFAAGKRIAWQPILGNWEFLSKPSWYNSVNRYKIIEDDETYYCQPHSPFGVLKTTFTKCALTGKITAEVVNDLTK